MNFVIINVNFNYAGEVVTRTGDSYEKSVDIHFNDTDIVKLICRVPKLYSNEWYEISRNISISREYLHNYETIYFWKVRQKFMSSCSIFASEISHWGKWGKTSVPRKSWGRRTQSHLHRFWDKFVNFMEEEWICKDFSKYITFIWSI